MTGDYQCVLRGEQWCATQEQANPPPAQRMGAWTTCVKWGVFRAGYERRRPTCAECVKHVEVWEARRGK